MLSVLLLDPLSPIPYTPDTIHQTPLSTASLLCHPLPYYTTLYSTPSSTLYCALYYLSSYHSISPDCTTHTIPYLYPSTQQLRTRPPSLHPSLFSLSSTCLALNPRPLLPPPPRSKARMAPTSSLSRCPSSSLRLPSRLAHDPPALPSRISQLRPQPLPPPPHTAPSRPFPRLCQPARSSRSVDALPSPRNPHRRTPSPFPHRLPAPGKSSR